MMSCGKKKRESISAHNETFYKNMPSDFEGALKYFKESDPFNPMLRNEAFLHEILQEDGEFMLSVLAATLKIHKKQKLN